MGLGSLGTDTRASIRVPASLSGVVGLKPTLGRVPTDGVVTLSWTMDHVAPMAATVPDAALLLDVLSATPAAARLTPLHDAALRAVARGVLPPRRASGGRARPWRIGVPEAGFAGAQPDVRDEVRAALDRAGEIGAVLVERGPARHRRLRRRQRLRPAGQPGRGGAGHRRLGTDLSRCWTEVADQLAAAGEIPAVDYLDAQRRRAQLADDLLAAFDHVDLLALPTTLVTAPPVDDFADYLMVLARNAIPFSFVGFPAVSIPAAGTAPACRSASSWWRRPGREARLLVAAAVLEADLNRGPGGGRAPWPAVTEGC